jgi:uncharacterized protein with PIN domain
MEKRKNYFLIRKNGGLYCPDCDVELEFDRHFVGMMDRYRVGNEGDNYVCPKCKQIFFEITIFRD